MARPLLNRTSLSFLKLTLSVLFYAFSKAVSMFFKLKAAFHFYAQIFILCGTISVFMQCRHDPAAKSSCIEGAPAQEKTPFRPPPHLLR
jgi:hypothetical protein